MRGVASHDSFRKSRPYSCIGQTQTEEKKNDNKKLQFRLSQLKNTNLMTGIFNGSVIKQLQNSPNRPSSNRETETFHHSASRLKKKSLPKSTKSVEQLLQQNQQLKQQINKLKEQICIVKGKNCVMSKKVKQNPAGECSEWDIDFEKDIYWSSDEKSYRILGMKQQYLKLKKQFEEERIEKEKLKIHFVKSGVPQMEIMVQELLIQNARLNEVLKSKNKNEIFSPQKLRLQQSKNKREQVKIVEKVQNLEQINKEMKQKLKIKNKHIQFLERSLIAKGNSQHSTKKRNRILQKQKQQLIDICEKLQKQSFALRKKQETQVQNLKSLLSNQIETVRKNWKKIVLQKDKKIKILQESTKASEEVVQKGRQSPIDLQNKSGVSRKTSFDYSSVKLLSQEQNIPNSTSRRYKSNINEAHVFINSPIFENSEPKNTLDSIKINQTQQKRFKTKPRKVDFLQVKQIGDLMKHRMIYQKIKPDSIKQLFDFSEQKNDEEESGDVWQKQYISENKVKEIFLKAPFLLTSDQSAVLARYLIEDEEQAINNGSENENRRDIVKSIIKALLGQYEIFNAEQESKAKGFYQHYAVHLQSALHTYYPNGFVSKAKLYDILCAIGAEPTQSQFNYLISKTSLDSQSLEELDYNKIFDKL